MGPRFNDPLYFQADGSLDVCGPTNFHPNDVLFRLVRVTFQQDGKDAITHEYQPPKLFGCCDSMWDGDIDDARGRLALGQARATGEGRVLHRNGQEEPVTWANFVHLIAPATFLDAE